MSECNTIVLSNMHFLSAEDKHSFFVWADTISCIEYVKENKQDIILHIELDDLDSYMLKDIIALLSRYHTRSMPQLKRYLRTDNQAWFKDNVHAFWHKHVFGTA